MKHKKEPQVEKKAKTSRGVLNTVQNYPLQAAERLVKREMYLSPYEYVYKCQPTGVEDSWTYPMPSEKERDRRWQSIRKSMKNNGVDLLIVAEPLGDASVWNYIYYISNYHPYANIGSFVVFPLNGDPQIVFKTGIGPQFVHCASKFSWIKDIVSSPDPVQDIV